MRALFIFIITLAGSNLFAQKISEDFARIYNAYLADHLALDFSIKVYADKDDQKGVSAGDGMVRKISDRYYTRYNGQEILINDDGIVIADRETQSIAYYKGRKSNLPARTNAMQIDSTMLANADSVRYLESSNGKSHYRVYDNSLPTYMIDFYVDMESSLISSIVYYYKPGTKDETYEMYKMVVEYTTVSTAAFAPGIDFSTNKYITTVNKKPVPASAYRAYTLNVIQ